MTDQLADYRRFYAQLLVQTIGRPTDHSLKQALETVPRENFLDKGPWQVPDLHGGYIDTPTDSPEFLYQDTLLALDPAKGINNGLPSLHARNIAALDITRGESILHIGAGSGYYTAVLAEVTGEQGSVIGYEYEPALAKRAAAALQPWPQTTLVQGSVFDAELPNADVIYANAGMPQIQTRWINALNNHGRLLFPLTCSNGWGVMMLVLKHGEDLFVSVVNQCGFIGCIGAANRQASDKLETAFATGFARRVSRLYLSKPLTGQQVLLSGDGWYLCSES